MYDIIYLAPIGAIPLTDGRHVQNHLKYLYSCSSAHPQNEKTVRNHFFRISVDALSKRQTLIAGFVGDGKKDYNTAKNELWNLTADPSVLRSDRTYIGFIVNIGGRMISNMFGEEIGETLSIQSNPDHVIQYFVDDYHAGDINQFYETIEKRVAAGGELLIPLSKATKEEHRLVEFKVHQLLFQKAKAERLKIIVSMSHHDQDDGWHIHRLMTSTN